MKKILVADREEPLCQLYQEELTEEGYDVVSVTRPEDLIQAVEREKPDLLLMDTAMNEQGVWIHLKEMRKSGYRLPIILNATYFAFEGFPEEFIDDTVIKSSNFDELKTKIKRILRKGRELFSSGTRLVVGK